jgi:hypothetical protein
MASQKPIATVKFSELDDAFLFVSSCAPFEHNAYIDVETGEIHYESDESEMEEDVPDDLESSDRYISVPHKNDLNLGSALALSFVAEAVRGQYDTVAGFFRRSGAYRRFKDFLEARDLLEDWYAFELRETGKALRAWCRENDIAVIDERSRLELACRGGTFNRLPGPPRRCSLSAEQSACLRLTSAQLR